MACRYRSTPWVRLKRSPLVGNYRLWIAHQFESSLQRCCMAYYLQSTKCSQFGWHQSTSFARSCCWRFRIGMSFVGCACQRSSCACSSSSTCQCCTARGSWLLYCRRLLWIRTWRRRSYGQQSVARSQQCTTCGGIGALRSSSPV